MDAERAGGWRLAGVVLGSIALAVVVGGLAGMFAYAGGGSGDGSGFEDLGRSLVGLAAAVLVGVITFVWSVVVGVRRTLPPGRRLGTVVVVLVAAVAVVVGPAWASENSRRADLDALGPIVSLLVLGAAAAAIGAVAGLLPRRPVGALVAGTVVALAAVAVAVEGRADDITDGRRAAEYESTGAPLALIDGTDLDAGFVGWDEPFVGGHHPPGTVTVDYEVGQLWLELVFESDPEPIDCRADPCEDLGRRPDGTPIRGRLATGAQGGQVEDVDVWVDVDGGRWRVTGWDEAVDPGSAVAVLQALEPVDAEAFVAGT